MGFYADITRRYGHHISQAMKNWRNDNTRLASFRNRLIFLIKCKKHSIFPSHILNNFKSLEYATVGYSAYMIGEANRLINNFKRRVLNFEVGNTYAHIEFLTAERNNLMRTVEAALPRGMYQKFNYTEKMVYNKVFNNIKLNNINKFNRIKSQTHVNAFTRFSHSGISVDEYSNETNTQNLNTINNVPTTTPASQAIARYDVAGQHTVDNNTPFFINLTNIDVPSNVIQVLSNGPKFSLPVSNYNIPIHKILADCECILSDIDPESRDVCRSDIAYNIMHFIRNTKNRDTRNIENQLEVVRFLKNNPNILITISDKSNVTVCMYKDKYQQELLALLSDRETYKPLPSDPTYKYERKTNKLINELKTKKFITEDTCKQLTKRNSSTPCIYGIPKTHKTGVPLRPIISNTNSHSKYLAKFLADILKISFQQYNCFRIQDSFQFAASVNGSSIPGDHVLVSFDVVSLFTNIPIDLFIRIIRENWPLIQPNTNISKNYFIDLLSWVFESVYFLYGDQYYAQHRGAPMGSSLSPIVADIIMSTILRQISSKVSFSFGFLYQYVDDIACSVPEGSVHSTLSLFNNFNPSLRFTFEMESNRSLPFLDTLITRKDNIIKLQWYTKKSNSNRLLNYNSCCPTKYKINLISAMKDRIYKISHPDSRHDDLKKLYNILQKNGYPCNFTKRLIFSSASRHVNSAPTNNAGNGAGSREELQSYTQTQTSYRSLVYVPGVTDNIKKLFINKNNNIKISFTSAAPCSKYFSNLKTPIPLDQKNNIVYAVRCDGCSKFYIGQTTQRWRERSTQHRSDSRVNPKKCALANHIHQFGHTVNYQEVKVLYSEQNKSKRLFLENLSIKKHSDNLNTKEQSSALSIIYCNILQFIRNKII